MLKSISNLGNVLNKQEQQKINGGQIQCPPRFILKCNWLRCWCEPDTPSDGPADEAM